LSVTGGVFNTGVITGAGNLVLTGTMPQILYGTGYANNLIINNSSDSSSDVIVNPGDTTKLTGTLTMNSGTLTTHSGLTLVSNASGTARIATITGGSISGNVNVQQY